MAKWAVEEHPNIEMALTRSGRYLFVANANRNTVTVLDTTTGRTVETLSAAFTADMAARFDTEQPGVVALDESTLFVANACNNNVAVFDISAIGASRSLGFIPVG